MGVHYINLGMGLEKTIDADLPNQLLFSNIDGRDQLVGAAYAFVDVPNTDVALPYESDLASWHDHPQLQKMERLCTCFTCGLWIRQTVHLQALTFGFPTKPRD